MRSRILILTAAAMSASPALAGGFHYVPSAESSAPWRWAQSLNASQVGVELGRVSGVRKGDRAVVECVVGPDLRPTGCSVIAQNRPGSGVGDASLSIVRRYKAQSRDAAGVSTVGRRFLFGLQSGGAAKL